MTQQVTKPSLRGRPASARPVIADCMVCRYTIRFLRKRIDSPRCATHPRKTSHLDEYGSALDNDGEGFERFGARQRARLSAADIEFALVPAALDDVALQIALVAERGTAVGAQILSA